MSDEGKRYWMIPHNQPCGFPICDHEQRRVIGYADTTEDGKLIVDALNETEEE